MIVKLVNKMLKEVAENHATVMGQNLKIAQQKRSFYGILPFAIVCT
jgi:hypothetical protein